MENSGCIWIPTWDSCNRWSALTTQIIKPVKCKSSVVTTKDHIFFLYLGPVYLCSNFKHCSLMAYCAKDHILVLHMLMLPNKKWKESVPHSSTAISRRQNISSYQNADSVLSVFVFNKKGGQTRLQFSARYGT